MNGSSGFHPARTIFHSKAVLFYLARRLLYRVGMNPTNEKSEMYQRAVNFADRIYRFANELPKGQWTVGDQFKRAAMSIATIIAEANGEWYSHERKDFYMITRGSAYDCLPLLELCRQRNLIEDSVYENFKTEVDVLARMMTQLVQTIDI